MAKSALEVYYFFDPICGWCYGFGPAIADFRARHKDDAHFHIISGGIVVGDRVGPANAMQSYIEQAHKQVEQMTGVTFGQPFLKELLPSTTPLGSLEPSIAMVIYRLEQPETAFEFAKKLQYAIYYDGMAPTDMDALAKLLTENGIAHAAEKLADPSFTELAQEDFSLSADMGVQGFPTLIVRHKKEYFLLANGYTPPIQLEQRWQSILNQ